jgi:prepilin-type processing-associated H-X9-DG protein
VQLVLVGECRDGREDDDNNNYDDDNGPYIEIGGTNWTEIYNQLSSRHGNGQNLLFADGHTAYRNRNWFRSPEGKYAICPSKKDTNTW